MEVQQYRILLLLWVGHLGVPQPFRAELSQPHNPAFGVVRGDERGSREIEETTEPHHRLEVAMDTADT